MTPMVHHSQILKFLILLKDVFTSSSHKKHNGLSRNLQLDYVYDSRKYFYPTLKSFSEIASSQNKKMTSSEGCFINETLLRELSKKRFLNEIFTGSASTSSDNLVIEEPFHRPDEVSSEFETSSQKGQSDPSPSQHTATSTYSMVERQKARKKSRLPTISDFVQYSLDKSACSQNKKYTKNSTDKQPNTRTPKADDRLDKVYNVQGSGFQLKNCKLQDTTTPIPFVTHLKMVMCCLKACNSFSDFIFQHRSRLDLAANLEIMYDNMSTPHHEFLELVNVLFNEEIDKLFDCGSHSPLFILNWLISKFMRTFFNMTGHVPFRISGNEHFACSYCSKTIGPGSEVFKTCLTLRHGQNLQKEITDLVASSAYPRACLCTQSQTPKKVKNKRHYSVGWCFYVIFRVGTDTETSLIEVPTNINCFGSLMHLTAIIFNSEDIFPSQFVLLFKNTGKWMLFHGDGAVETVISPERWQQEIGITPLCAFYDSATSA